MWDCLAKCLSFNNIAICKELVMHIILDILIPHNMYNIDLK